MWPKPHSDFKKPKGPAHEFPDYSSVCMRCGKALTYIEDTKAPCMSDEALHLAAVVRRLRRQGA